MINIALARVCFCVNFFCHFLQKSKAQVGTRYTKKLAAILNRHRNCGQPFGLALHYVRKGVEHASLLVSLGPRYQPALAHAVGVLGLAFVFYQRPDG